MARSTLAALLVLSLAGAAGLVPAPAPNHRCRCGTHRSARPCTCAHCGRAGSAVGSALRSCGGEESARAERGGEPAILVEVSPVLEPAPVAAAPPAGVRPRHDPPSPEPPRPRRA